MYRLYCDGFPLLDLRDNDLIIADPKVKLEVNTVGEGSFTIYKNHPHYDKLKKLKSVFEVTDDDGVIFRGRATGDTVDINHGMFVDLEGAMAFFNDSIVRSFNFPDDFKDDANYIAAAKSGNVVAFFLGWLIDNHNDQVQDFQKMKLGNVTVTDPNNYLGRSSDDYASTWEVMKAKLFDSSLGGYLCVRYEADGNYVDYLSEFTETNSQEIVFGENILDLKKASEASETYSAIIPIGTIGLTIAGLADRNLTDDLVKKGDTIYSKQAVAEYGWIYAPVSETTWDDVTDDANLLTKGADWLLNRASLMNAMEATAVDLHFTNEQIESLRIYKNVKVYSEPHGISETLPLSKLEIDLVNPQNTVIKVGRSLKSLTERTANLQEEAKLKYSKLSKNDQSITLEVMNLKDNLGHSLTLDEQGVVISSIDGKAVTISGGQIEASELKAEDINAANLQLTGTISFSDFDIATQEEINAKVSEGDFATIINDQLVASPNIIGANIYGATYTDLLGYGSLQLALHNNYGSTPWLKFSDAKNSVNLFEVLSTSVNSKTAAILFGGNTLFALYDDGGIGVTSQLTFNQPIVLTEGVHYGSSYPTSPSDGQLFFKTV